MGQVRLRASVLPARAAYLIKDGSVRGFRRAIGEATTRWAGACEPIIPVNGRTGVMPAFDQMVRASAVDGFVNVDAAPGMAAKVGAAYGLPVVPIKRIDREGTTRLTTHVAHLSHRQNPHAGASPLIACAGGALWEAVAAGDLSHMSIDDMSASALSPRRPRSNDEIARAQLVRNTLIDLTTSEFSENSTSGQLEPSPALVWVTEPESLPDCLWFWNVRALRSLRFDLAPMLILPVTDIEFWPGFSRQLHAVLARNVDIQPDALIRSFSVRPKRLRQIAELLELDELKSAPTIQRSWPAPPRRTAPFTYAANIDERQFVLHERRYGQATDALVEMHRAGTAVRFTSPVEGANGRGGALIRVSSSIFDGLPRHPALASAIHRDGNWVRDELQVGVSNSARIELELRSPSWDEAVDILLRGSTRTAALSDKGRIASRLHELAASRAMLVPFAFDVVQRLTTPRSKELLRVLSRAREAGDTDSRLHEIAATWGGRVERRSATSEDLVRAVGPGAIEAAEVLTENGWAERGLTVSCTRCSLRGFVRMEDTSATARCASCRADQSYERSDRSLLVSYRLNSLLDRASDQGVVPHLIAVAALTTKDPRTHLLPGVDVVCLDQTKAEVDIYGLHDGMVIVGEAKTSASEFSEEQLERDVRVVNALRADAYVMACPKQIGAEAISKALTQCERLGLKLLTVQGPDVALHQAG